MSKNAPTSLVVRVADAVRQKLGYGFPKLGPVAYRMFFKILPRKIAVELLPGIHARLDTTDGTQRSTYWTGYRFEHPTPSILRDWAGHPEAIFFDIGSNYGWFSFFLASELPELPIYSFEPNPATFEHLQSIATENRLGSIHPYNLGLGDRSTTCHLRIGISDSGHSTFGPHPEFSNQQTLEIPIKPFDLWRKDAGLELPATPSWVAKIDVEGFECRVISGMSEALAAHAFRGLAIEVNPYTLAFCGDNEEKLLSMLEGFGYVESSPQPGEMNKFFVPRN